MILIIYLQKEDEMSGVVSFIFQTNFISYENLWLNIILLWVSTQNTSQSRLD